MLRNALSCHSPSIFFFFFFVAHLCCVTSWLRSHDKGVRHRMKANKKTKQNMKLTEKEKENAMGCGNRNNQILGSRTVIPRCFVLR